MKSKKDLDLWLRPCKALKARKERNLLKENRISELPDDILILILSSLTMKEAGMTSVLSKRWRHVWAYIPGLNFDYCKTVTRYTWKEHECEFVRWVDKVVSSHKAPTIDEFRVEFDLSKNRKDNVDSWLKFAADKRVRRLQLEIKPFGGFGNSLSYTFPMLSFNSLTSLQLVEVDVTGEVLEKLLYDCQTLEFVLVAFSDSLVSLKVAAGSSVNLKSLGIIGCLKMTNLEIDAPNLVNFKYEGRRMCWPLKRTPKLAGLSIGGLYCYNLVHMFSDVSNLASQIEVLTLNIRSVFVNPVPRVFPAFTKLKILDVNICPYSVKELFRICSLINACPLLQKLTFENSNPKELMTKKMRKMKACPHHNLKNVEIVAFQEYESDLEVVKYLIKIAVALEKIIIEPIDVATRLLTSDEVRTRATNQANKLYSSVMPQTELIIRQVPPRDVSWSSELEIRQLPGI